MNVLDEKLVEPKHPKTRIEKLALLLMVILPIFIFFFISNPVIQAFAIFIFATFFTLSSLNRIQQLGKRVTITTSL